VFENQECLRSSFCKYIFPQMTWSNNHKCISIL